MSCALLLLGDGPSCCDQVSLDPSDQRPHMGCFSHWCQGRCAAGGVDIVLTVYSISWSHIIHCTLVACRTHSIHCMNDVKG